MKRVNRRNGEEKERVEMEGEGERERNGWERIRVKDKRRE